MSYAYDNIVPELGRHIVNINIETIFCNQTDPIPWLIFKIKAIRSLIILIKTKNYNFCINF